MNPGTDVSGIRPPAEVIDEYRRRGLWRTDHLLAGLYRQARDRPDAPAIIGYRSDGTGGTLSWARYADQVEKFASGLRALGAGPGHVVAVQLPNWWETGALMLAVLRTGAVVAPLIPALRPRELERILASLGVTVMVTVGRWQGFDHAAALAEMAGRLPRLRQRVVLGQRSDTTEVDFAAHFSRTSWATEFPMPLADLDVDPDQIALVLYTSGTTGDPRAVLHTANTMSASAATIVAEEGIGASDVTITPHNLTHISGITTGIVDPLLTGAATVLVDTWSPRRAAEIIQESGVTLFSGAPVFVESVLRESTAAGIDMSSLRYVFSGATPLPSALVRDVYKAFGVPIRAAFGMTEVPIGTWTRADDPPEWAARSDGRPGPAAEFDLRGDGVISPENPARLYVRGAGVCVALAGRDSGTVDVIAEHDGGWFDTGDLVVPDGRRGIRYVGRATDRVGASLMIPVADVEAQIREHPRVADVAIVGYADGDGQESGCAVVVASGPPVTVGELRASLSAAGMTEFYQPTRVEVVETLPRNADGKVLKRELRQWVQQRSGTNHS